MAVLNLYLNDLQLENSVPQSVVHPEALAWCCNVRRVMQATGVLENKVRKSTLWSPFFITGKFNVRHLFKKLRALNIVDDETGRKLDFFGMDYEQRCMFVDQMLADEAEGLSEKIRRIPQLAEAMAAENQFVLGMMAVNGIDGGRAGSDLGEVLLKVRGGFDIFANYPHRSISTVRSVWSGKVKRGDILAALPKHGYPWVWANLNPRVTHKMGHLAIITKDIEETTDIYSKCTVECMLKKGVHQRTMKNWDTPHYVLGVQKIIWHWNSKDGLLRKEAIPVEDTAALADMAEKFIGHTYVRWYEIVTCKWVAPLRFTCSTLVWWCAKKAYGFSVSNWLYAYTTPTDILRNPATYIKTQVK